MTHIYCTLDCMVGDVNLFFNDVENKSLAEIELMIAGKEGWNYVFIIIAMLYCCVIIVIVMVTMILLLS